MPDLFDLVRQHNERERNYLQPKGAPDRTTREVRATSRRAGRHVRHIGVDETGDCPERARFFAERASQ